MTAKPTIQELRKAARDLELAFRKTCKLKGIENWEFYRRIGAGIAVPEACLKAHDDYTFALHAFFRARDGEEGFLGGKSR